MQPADKPQIAWAIRIANGYAVNKLRTGGKGYSELLLRTER